MLALFSGLVLLLLPGHFKWWRQLEQPSDLIGSEQSIVVLEISL